MYNPHNIQKVILYAVAYLCVAKKKKKKIESCSLLNKITQGSKIVTTDIAKLCFFFFFISTIPKIRTARALFWKTKNKNTYFFGVNDFALIYIFVCQSVYVYIWFFLLHCYFNIVSIIWKKK